MRASVVAVRKDRQRVIAAARGPDGERTLRVAADEAVDLDHVAGPRDVRDLPEQKCIL